MTNNVLSVNNNLRNVSGNNKAYAYGSGELFSSVLQSKINSSAMSIGSFDNISAQDNSNNLSSGLYGGASSNPYSGGGMYNQNLLTGLNGNGLSSGSSKGTNSETMLMLIFMAMVLGAGGGEGSQLMLSSMAEALSGGNNYRSVAYGNTQQSAFNGLSLTGSAYKSTYVSPGTGSYPSSMGQACSPKVVNNVGNRSALAYNDVIKQFNVETNSRYTPYKNGSTYCNIYVWDVTTAMGAQIPHRVDSNGDIAEPGTKNVKYMTANSMYDWLGGKGKEYGWKEVSAEEAQKYANMGCPAVTTWKNPKGHGHIQMVVPSKDGKYNEAKGVAISQAGSKVIGYGYITDVYKSSRLKDIKYFVHA